MFRRPTLPSRPRVLKATKLTQAEKIHTLQIQTRVIQDVADLCIPLAFHKLDGSGVWQPTRLGNTHKRIFWLRWAQSKHLMGIRWECNEAIFKESAVFFPPVSQKITSAIVLTDIILDSCHFMRTNSQLIHTYQGKTQTLRRWHIRLICLQNGRSITLQSNKPRCQNCRSCDPWQPFFRGLG